jgi:citrate lyase synthetase
MFPSYFIKDEETVVLVHAKLELTVEIIINRKAHIKWR